MKNAQWTTLVVIILLISIQVGAQKFTTTMGPKIPADPQYVVGGLLDANVKESFVYFWYLDEKTNKRSISIAKHNEDLEEVWFKNFQSAVRLSLIHI